MATGTTTSLGLGLHLPSHSVSNPDTDTGKSLQFSALTQRILSHTQARTPPESQPDTRTADADGLAVAHIVAHNLQHQHEWADVVVIPAATVPDILQEHVLTSGPSEHERKDSAGIGPPACPRAMVCGRPPHRLYVHPDQQIEELMLKHSRAATSKPTPGNKPAPGRKETEQEPEQEPELAPRQVERVFVLPTRKPEKISLAELGTVFDALPLPVTPSTPLRTGISGSVPVEARGRREWEQTKRLLLAAADDDSTVAYYIVHDGIVKPRQN